MTAELEARRQIDARIHGFRVQLGKARAAATRADTLDDKIARHRHLQELQQELSSLHRRYWEEVAKLEDAAYEAGY